MLKKQPLKIVKKIVWVVNTKYALLLLLFPFLYSCKKDTIQLPWTELTSGIDAKLTDVYFQNDQEGHIVGGNTWFEGVYLYTDDAGVNWTSEPLGDKQLFGLHLHEDNRVYTVGIDGYLFAKEQDSLDWTFYRTPRFDILRGLDFNREHSGVLVGGVAFNKGTIMLVDSNTIVQQVDTLAFQLDAVCFSDQQVVHAVGYGIILRSEDGGRTWQESETKGDHFRAVNFPSPNIGYIVGSNGTILKSKDAGRTWDKIRNGDAIVVSDKAFRDVYFVDEDYGYIVGAGGLCWRTEDGGASWSIIEGFPSFDFNAISLKGRYGFIVGDEGRILRFED